VEFKRYTTDIEEIKKLKREFKKRGIPFVDRHTHSISKFTKSFNLPKKIVGGEPPVEGPSLQIIDFASRAGFDEIAITDHSYEIFLFPKMEERTQVQKNYGDQTFNKYIEYIEAVKKKYSNIRVLGGIELKLRDTNDLKFVNPNKLSKLDFILIETMIKKPDFRTIRKKLGEEMIILFAHPDPKYGIGDNYNQKDISEWVDNMVDNNIGFDINRQFLDNLLSDDPLYRSFFKIATEKGLLFSIGTDYHCIVRNYPKFFTKTLEVITKYNLTKDNFWRFKNDCSRNF